MIGTPLAAGGNSLVRRAQAFLILLILSCAVGVTNANAASADAPIEVISHADHANVVLDRKLLRALFMLRMRQWPDGATVHVFVMADGNEIHDQFCRARLGTYPYVLRSAWDRVVFTGMGLAPTTVRSREEMILRVSSTPGSIGYVQQRNPALLIKNLAYHAAPSVGPPNE